MNNVSYSQYRAWKTCPFMWKLSYVNKLAPEDQTIHVVFGTAMHATIQEWLHLLYQKSAAIASAADLPSLLKEELKKEFAKRTTEQDGVKIFPCNKDDLMDAYNDGVEILTYLKKHAKDFFPTDEWGLEGVEVPLNISIQNNVTFIAYLDIILRHKLTGRIRIIDLKTSNRGWGEWKRNDKTTINQLLVYKHYYAQQYNVPETSISVEFHILQRKIDWKSYRVTKFKPSHGYQAMKQAKQDFDAFVRSCFDENGNPITEQKPTPSKSNCMFCPFRDKPDICSASYYAKINS